MNIIATLGSVESNAKNHSGNKELVSAYSVIGNRDGKLTELVFCRCYMGRSRSAQVVYASIWVKMRGDFTSGTGKSGGYGYHKESAAIHDAIESAGITLSESIHGSGDSAIREALLAIGRMAGGEGELLFIRHS